MFFSKFFFLQGGLIHESLHMKFHVMALEFLVINISCHQVNLASVCALTSVSVNWLLFNFPLSTNLYSSRTYSLYWIEGTLMQLTEFSCFNCLGPNYFFLEGLTPFLNVIQKNKYVNSMDETILLMYKWASFPVYLKGEDVFFLSVEQSIKRHKSNVLVLQLMHPARLPWNQWSILIQVKMQP